ncbi:MAG TPA: hypothetical protein VFY58_08725 [Nocardioides sp.]|nr:hypothetical protein [Nocardioides sp.]
MSRPPGLTRRTLLSGSLAVPGGVVLAGCTEGSTPGSGPTHRPTDPSPHRPAQEAAIFDLTLRETDRHRPFELIAPGFVAADVGRLAPGGGALALHSSGPPAPFAAVEARLPAARGTIALGLATEDGDHVLVRWSAESSRVTLEVRTGGRSRTLRRRKAKLSRGDRLAFALCENQVTALVDSGGGWQPLLTERDKVAALIDLRLEAALARFRYAWATTGVTASDVRAGLFGMTGLRDPHLVQHADGSPYERDGRQFLTWTCAGLGFFQQAHWAVWSFDPASPRDLRLESQLFSRRDGLVLGDHAGHLVRHRDRWLVAASSWGDFVPGSIHVRHAETDADLLSGVHVIDTEPTPLPTSQGTWDPALLLQDGIWRVAFVESPSQDPFDFHPALARGPEATGSQQSDGSWTDDLELVAAADDLTQCEGPIFASVGSETWLLASDKIGKNYPVFDLDGRRRGRLDAPYPTNIPHPQLIPDPGGGWWMVTFDNAQYAERVMGYGGHGDVVLMHSV